ncbi:alpha/beta fold hydrolase [Vibrio sp.]|uniref:alpha/beta fold hydrolase n=1 Tax=Vibrio sp. TaxID=678 RepID=UPI003D0DD992
MRQKQYPIADGHITTLELGDAGSAEHSMVFVHGWLDNAASFEQLMPQLHQQLPDWHLCAIDLPGHGLSSHKPGGSFYPFHDYIDDLHQFLSALPASQVVLVGHSLGALITSCYSAAFPEQVSGLVQIEGYGPLAEEPQLCVDRLRQGVIDRQRLRRKPVRGFDSPEQAIMRRAGINQVSEQQIAPIVLRGLAQREQRWWWRHDIRLQSASLYRMDFQHAEQFIQSVRCPQLVILGQDGYSHLKSNMLKNEPPHAQFLQIPGGHHCHLQHPDRVNALISDLVNKIKTSV